MLRSSMRNLTTSWHTFLMAVLSLGLGLAAARGASVLLQVDGSDPSFVTLTATGNKPLINDSSATTFDGVTLLGFWSHPTSDGLSMMGNLTPHGATVSYDTWGPSDYSGSRIDLSLYHSIVPAAPQDFAMNATAFTGMGYALGMPLGNLPAPGTVGDIIAGWYLSGEGHGGDLQVIGQWQMVPEPSTLALALAALAAFALLGSRRK
jgi:hypothetical protein